MKIKKQGNNGRTVNTKRSLLPYPQIKKRMVELVKILKITHERKKTGSLDL
jgi:hypothetical protein